MQQKNHKAIAILVAVMFTVLSTFALVNISESENTAALISESENTAASTVKREFSDRNTIVLSDDAFLSNVKGSLKEHTSKVEKTQGLSSAKTGDIAVIDESWIYQNNTRLIDEEIVKAAKKNVPLIFVGESSYLFKESSISFQSMGYSDDETVYGVYKNSDGINFFLSVESDDASLAVAIAYSWANALSSGDDSYNDARTFSWMESGGESGGKSQSRGETRLSPLGASQSGGAYWGLMDIKTSIKTCGSYGSISQTTELYKLQNFNDAQYDYYSYHFYQFGQPTVSNGSRIADMYLEGRYGLSNVSLINHSPTTTSGSSSVGVSLGVGVSATGPSGSGSASWSYSISDVVLLNRSQLGTDVVDFWHDVNESKAVGSGYNAQPSTTVRVLKGTSYAHCDIHSIQFCKEFPFYIVLNTGHHIKIGVFYSDFQKYIMNYTININGGSVTGSQTYVPF